MSKLALPVRRTKGKLRNMAIYPQKKLRLSLGIRCALI
jgi:hypothetical protein